MNPALYFWIFFKASLFSTGGTGNLPSLHADLIALHHATDRQFAEALLVGQLSPGPTGLWSVSLGYLTGGPLGALLATIALSLPPLLILGIERVYRRISEHPAVEGLMRGLGLSISGIFVVILPTLLSSTGVNVRTFIIAGVAVALALTRRVPLMGIIALAAVAGLVTAH